MLKREILRRDVEHLWLEHGRAWAAEVPIVELARPPLSTSAVTAGARVDACVGRGIPVVEQYLLVLGTGNSYRVGITASSS